MKQLIALFTLLLSQPAMADMIATVDDSDVDEMQTIQLTVRITGTDQADKLDTAPLESDFHVQGTSTQSQFRSVNGRVSSWVEYHVTLRPKRTGTLVIPALELGGETSNPVRVVVRPVAADVKAAIDKLVYFDVQLDRDTVYVQSQVVLTRRLYYTAGVQIYGDLPGAPDLPNAVVLPLGEATSNTTMRGSTRYGVLEQRYAIFPERSGELTIPGFSVTSSVRLPDRGRRGVRVTADSKTINVQPVPESYPAHLPWFPAANVSINESWDPQPDRVASGDALMRTIELRARGATGSAIPPITATMPDQYFKEYAQPPDIADDATGRSVIGQRTQPYQLIATHGGTVTAPDVEVTWWDTNADQLRTSRLPGRTFSIRGAAPETTPNEQTETPVPDRAEDTQPAEKQQQTVSLKIWWWLALLPLAIVAVWLVLKHPPRRPPSPYSAARRQIQQSTRIGEIQMALTLFARARWGLSLGQASAAIRQRTSLGAALLDELNQAAYGSGDGKASDFEARSLDLLKQIRDWRADSDTVDALPALYSS